MHLHVFTTGVIATCLLAPVDASANDLIGCWQSEKITQFLADGRSHTKSSSPATIEFTAGEIVTRTGAPPQFSEIRYRYALVRPGVYTATMTAHKLRPDLIGSQREYEYKADGARLSIATYPQTTQPAPPTAAVKVESTSRRVPCKTETPRS